MGGRHRDITAFLPERVIPAGDSRHGLVNGIEDYADKWLNLQCANSTLWAVRLHVERGIGVGPEAGLA